MKKENLKILKIKFQYLREFDNYKHYIKGYEDIAEKKVNKAIDAISKLEYEKISLELTPNGEIFFSISFSNNVIKFYIVLHLDSKKSEEESFFTHFVGDDCIDNGIGSFKNVIADIKTILTK